MPANKRQVEEKNRTTEKYKLQSRETKGIKMAASPGITRGRELRQTPPRKKEEHGARTNVHERADHRSHNTACPATSPARCPPAVPLATCLRK